MQIPSGDVDRLWFWFDEFGVQDSILSMVGDTYIEGSHSKALGEIG